MILRDPVHGLIAFQEAAEDIVVRLLQAKELQRLRRIRSLGPASLAFPGAEHSRFAHAVGSAHVMKRYLDRVRRLSADIPLRDRIDDDNTRIALAAALLHDLGHGPYSHTFEAAVGAGLRHEDWTSRMLLDPQTDVHRILAEVDPTAPAIVERLVHGEHPIRHLARAVSGTFDVDRCDYLMRDSHMTGVRYGLLDLDWLLVALRLYQAGGDGPAAAGTESPAILAVDGEKGLTAVEGFFQARLYMYRQVYLHKAVRAADAVFKALFQRLIETGPAPGTPPGLAALLVGRPVSLEQYLALDDPAIEHALARYEQGPDPVLRDLAGRLRHRRLFKTMRLRLDVPVADAQQRLTEVLGRCGITPPYLGTIDRVEIDAYADDQALVVLTNRRVHSLLEVSPVMRGLSREAFVHYRAIFPPEVRDDVLSAMADLR